MVSGMASWVQNSSIVGMTRNRTVETAWFAADAIEIFFQATNQVFSCSFRLNTICSLFGESEAVTNVGSRCVTLLHGRPKLFFFCASSIQTVVL